MRHCRSANNECLGSCTASPARRFSGIDDVDWRKRSPTRSGKRTMDLAVRPLHPLFAAEIRGVDLSRDIDRKTRHALAHAMDQYAVCVLPEQDLDDERQIGFSRLYG